MLFWNLQLSKTPMSFSTSQALLKSLSLPSRVCRESEPSRSSESWNPERSECLASELPLVVMFCCYWTWIVNICKHNIWKAVRHGYIYIYETYLNIKMFKFGTSSNQMVDFPLFHLSLPRVVLGCFLCHLNMIRSGENGESCPMYAIQKV